MNTSKLYVPDATRWINYFKKKKEQINGEVELV